MAKIAFEDLKPRMIFIDTTWGRFINIVENVFERRKPTTRGWADVVLFKVIDTKNREVSTNSWAKSDWDDSDQRNASPHDYHFVLKNIFLAKDW